jgi:proton-translocating NAD(P)+ transhydrogenase subunit alpha
MPTLFVPRETRAGETRVAATPDTVKHLLKAGLAVTVEAGAGAGSFLTDDEYAAAGATVTSDRRASWATADVVAMVREPAPEEAAALKAGAVLIGLLAPDRNLEMVERLAAGGVTSLAMELIPRVTRAQAMDALSSQASIAGYKAVLLAAHRLGKYFPLLMTAAGTIPPARVVVMGAGVAGLQALATARRLGAVVEVSDIREEVKEQVESLGGRFIDLPLAESGSGEGGYARQMSEDFLNRQREIVQRHLAAADVVVTTALVPGKPAPRLVTQAMVEAMRPGAVVVDLAVEAGGNCELSRADEEVDHGGVLVLAPSNLPATAAIDASMLYGRNVLELLLYVVKEGALTIDPGDEIVGPTLLTHGGEVLHPPTAEKLAATARS